MKCVKYILFRVCGCISPVAEEAGLRVLGQVCRGTAGSCPPVNQHLSACSQGKSHSLLFPHSQHALRLSVEAVLLFKSVEFAILLPKVRVHACACRIQTSWSGPVLYGFSPAFACQSLCPLWCWPSKRLLLTFHLMSGKRLLMPYRNCTGTHKHTHTRAYPF